MVAIKPPCRNHTSVANYVEVYKQACFFNTLIVPRVSLLWFLLLFEVRLLACKSCSLQPVLNSTVCKKPPSPAIKPKFRRNSEGKVGEEGGNSN